MRKSKLSSIRFSKELFYPLASFAFFVSLFLFHFENKSDGFFWKEFFDAGHVVLFFLFTIGPAHFYRKFGSLKVKSIIAIGTISLVLASTVELIQPYFGRSSSLEDVLLGLLGIIAACIYLTPFPNMRAIGILLFIAFQLFGAAPAIRGYYAIQWRAKAFPLLAEFESPEEESLWTGSIERSSKRAVKGRHSLKLEATPDIFAAYYAGGKDWSEYSTLSFSILNPSGKTESISIRINDDGECWNYEQRFNRTIPLKPGFNLIEIPTSSIRKGPVDRELNLSAITSIYLFSVQTSGAEDVYLDSMKLKP